MSGQDISSSASSLLISAIQTGTLSRVSPDRLLTSLIDEEATGLKSLQDELLLGTVVVDTETSNLLRSMRLVARQLGVRPGERAILVNGRVSSLVFFLRVYAHGMLLSLSSWVHLTRVQSFWQRISKC